MNSFILICNDCGNPIVLFQKESPRWGKYIDCSKEDYGLFVDFDNDEMSGKVIIKCHCGNKIIEDI